MVFIIFGIIIGLGLVVYGSIGVRQFEEGMATRLSRYNLRTASSLTELELQIPRSERILGPARRSIARRVRQVTPNGTIENVQVKLLQAGNPKDMTVQDFLGIKGMAAIALAVGAFLFMTFLVHPDVVKFVLIIIGAGVAGFFLPDLWLRQIRKKRQEEIQKFMADAIDLLAISVEAGQGFDGALQTLSSRKHNALTEEFDRFRLETQAGKGRRDALRDLADRTGVEDLNTFVAALIQADQLGIGISHVLKTQAEELRIKRRQRAEEKARQAPIKMLFPLILLMFPSLFIVILGPAVPTLTNLH
ncbi:MAG TPA: type II secretion system F family protein [Chloroflexota bacterium]|nr:type II secretion system F family protein [Chloroflexota bacterium]